MHVVRLLLLFQNPNALTYIRYYHRTIVRFPGLPSCRDLVSLSHGSHCSSCRPISTSLGNLAFYSPVPACAKNLAPTCAGNYFCSNLCRPSAGLVPGPVPIFLHNPVPDEMTGHKAGTETTIKIL